MLSLNCIKPLATADPKNSSLKNLKIRIKPFCIEIQHVKINNQKIKLVFSVWRVTFPSRPI